MLPPSVPGMSIVNGRENLPGNRRPLLGYNPVRAAMVVLSLAQARMILRAMRGNSPLRFFSRHS